MSDFPSLRYQLPNHFFDFINHGTCRGCHEPIEWWKTPNGKRIPMNPMPDEMSEAKPHWAVCPQADQFRKGRSRS